jgi:hypothetical protein
MQGQQRTAAVAARLLPEEMPGDGAARVGLPDGAGDQSLRWGEGEGI